MEHLFKINEIFKSIDGEGVRTGLPVTFIRLNGCNLRCKYCDTQYACDTDEFELMTVSEIVDEVLNLKSTRVTLTGGEPLLDPYVNDLIIDLMAVGIEVNVETNGSIDISECPANIITMDYKCGASGMEHKMNTNNLEKLREQDVLKFVVGSISDLNRMKQVIENYNLSCRVYVSPVFGMIEPCELVEYVLENNLEDVTVQLQLHKIIWNPNTRGV